MDAAKCLASSSSPITQTPGAGRPCEDATRSSGGRGPDGVGLPDDDDDTADGATRFQLNAPTEGNEERLLLISGQSRPKEGNLEVGLRSREERSRGTLPRKTKMGTSLSSSCSQEMSSGCQRCKLKRRLFRV